jgi:hypothetical protein
MNTNPNLFAPLRRHDEIQPWPLDMRRSPADIERETWQERGVWSDTIPTQPAHLDGAHCCIDILRDDDAKSDPMPRGERIAMAVVMFIGFLALLAGVSVAWTRWLP